MDQDAVDGAVANAVNDSVGAATLTAVWLALKMAAEATPIPGFPPGGDPWMQNDLVLVSTMETVNRTIMVALSGIDLTTAFIRGTLAGADIADMPEEG